MPLQTKLSIMAKKQFFTDLAQNIAKNNQQVSTSEIIILDELSQYINPLSLEEFEQLRQNLIAEGCRDALIVWETAKGNILVDGHNRLRICSEQNIPYKTVSKHFQNIDEVKDWMINNQLGKRNLTEEQKSYYRGIQYKNFKNKQGAKEGNLNAQKQSRQNDHFVMKTNELLAEQHKVSPKTIQRDEKYANAIDRIVQNNPSLKWKILSKEYDIPKNKIEDLSNLDVKNLNSFLNEVEKFGYSKDLLDKYLYSKTKEVEKNTKSLIDKKIANFEKIAKELIEQGVSLNELLNSLKKLK